MSRSKSSQRWLREHFSDPFVKRAQAEGMRSRAVYKLEELIERFNTVEQARFCTPGVAAIFSSPDR